MEASSWQRIKQVYADALDHLPPDRPAFLDSACGDDSALREQVESLLAADSAAGDFLQDSVSDSLTPDTAVSEEGPGTVIGRYTLQSLLGHGGFGSVYVAEQSEPVRRRVALKVIKLGMDTRQVTQRFEAERQALALMDHPHIARVFDGGATETGRPYFVMELVDGVPITQYCDEAHLDTPARLAIFQKICHAVQHAHQKGIIHRDLKPANVLVAPPQQRGESATPKVIDFGIAKATDVRLTDETVVTQQRQLLGTPAYMSPEQTGLEGDVDTRTDVYALGALLYELLTGQPPFDPATLSRASLGDVQRIIREEEPPRPSSHRADLRGDLEWIILKALDKDRTQRYETVAALAQDIGRHLMDEPVLAGPPSTAYRFRKFARRRRRLLTGIGVSLLVSLVGVAVLANSLFQTQRALVRAETAEQEAVASRDEAEAMVAFLQRMLGNADPDRALGRELTIREVLDVAAEQIIDAFPEMPLVEIRLRHAIGCAYWSLASFEAAERELTESLSKLEMLEDADPRMVALHHNSLGNLYQSLDRNEDAVRTFRTSLAIAETSTMPASQRTMIQGNLGGVLVELAQYQEAIDLLESTLEEVVASQGETEPTAQVLAQLGQAYVGAGRTVDSEQAYQRALDIRRRVLPPNHPDIAQTLRGLGQVLVERGDYAAAVPLFEEMIEIERQVLGEHPQLALSLNNFADLQSRLGNLDAAQMAFVEAIDIQRNTIGTEHTDIARTLNNLAGVYWRQGAFDLAEERLREAIEMHRTLSGADHPDVASGMSNLAILLNNRGAVEEAEQVTREALALQVRRLGETHPHTRRTMINLGSLLQQQLRFDEAEEIFRTVVRHDATLPENDLRRASGQVALGSLLSAAGQFKEAETMLLGAHQQATQLGGAGHPLSRKAATTLAVLYESWGQPEEGASWRARANAPAE